MGRCGPGASSCACQFASSSDLTALGTGDPLNPLVIGVASGRSLTRASTAGTPPSAPVVGMLWWQTDAHRLKVWDGSAWRLLTSQGSRMTTSGTNTMPTASLHKIGYASNSWDDLGVAGGWDTVTIVEPGLYLCALTIEWEAAGGAARLAQISAQDLPDVVDFRIARQYDAPTSGGNGHACNCSGIWRAAAGDVIGAWGFQDSGNDALNFNSRLDVVYLSPI